MQWKSSSYSKYIVIMKLIDMKLIDNGANIESIVKI